MINTGRVPLADRDQGASGTVVAVLATLLRQLALGLRRRTLAVRPVLVPAEALSPRRTTTMHKTNIAAGEPGRGQRGH